MSRTASPGPGQFDRGPQEASEAVAGFVNGGRLDGRESVEQPDLHAHAVARHGLSPGATHAAPDKDDVGEDAAEREERRLERAVGVDDRRAVAVAHRVLIKVGEQVRDWGRSPGRASRGVEPIVRARDDLVGEGRASERNADPRVSYRQDRPPDKVLNLSRAVAPEVAPRE